jgi:hypothetical protein
MPATPVIPEEQECDTIEDELEKDMNPLFDLFGECPNLRGSAMIISLLQSGFKSAGRSDTD